MRKLLIFIIAVCLLCVSCTTFRAHIGELQDADLEITREVN